MGKASRAIVLCTLEIDGRVKGRGNDVYVAFTS